MSAKVESKKFGKGTRTVPHHSEKAQKWYPAEADAQPRKVRLRFARDENAPVVEEPGTYGREEFGDIKWTRWRRVRTQQGPYYSSENRDGQHLQSSTSTRTDGDATET